MRGFLQMRRMLRWFAFVLIGLTAQGAFAQIAPLPYTPVPAAAPDFSPPANRATPVNQPKALIRGWSFNNEQATLLRQGGEVSLDPGNLDIILFFGADGRQGATTEFRYRLVDYDRDWTMSSGRVAHYRRLPPGRYRFEVQARAPGQPWLTDVANLTVVQRPFFYQTWYFYVLVLFGLIALAGQLLAQRDQLLKGQVAMVLEERNRIASDCHDTLMAGFAAISWQLEATANLFHEKDAATNPAAQSCELARSMVSHCQAEARRIIWDLRDSQEVTNLLSEALARTIGAHRMHDKVQTSFEVQGEEVPISPGAVHHLVCIGQEAVTNAIRHAESSKIVIALRYDSEALRLAVRDDGRGFELGHHAGRSGHFGILVMEERARKLGGDLRITSSADTGTEVAVTVGFRSIQQPAHQQHFVVPWIGV